MAIQGEWISTSVRKPRNTDDVLAIDEYKSIHIAFWEKRWSGWTGRDSRPVYGVTHWMPLPKIPKTIR